MGDELVCQECQRTTPLAPQLGWAILQYDGVPGWSLRFCSAMCLCAHQRKAMDRIVAAILDDSPSAS